ncbi:zinc-finger-containing protein [Olivibacter sp. 47]|uniref:zinc-finger-containing protein n=1 Tax=Olivibacter sp. 47 TaxID=3056486 RepID=UPI0025A32CA3|nr:zinc-finger-containing protein [Olivibacter sp. 47]MDM8174829.1 zinc-finger-containing protein [Olivibacter sp. 47]
MDKIKKQLINQGLVCPYCDAATVYVDSAEFYNGKSYGMVYACRPCKAWVGVHSTNPKVALGRLADSELRLAKQAAHYYFDIIWRRKHMSRSKAYEWLSGKLRVVKKECHIGYFDISQCNKVIELSRKFLSI